MVKDVWYTLYIYMYDDVPFLIRVHNLSGTFFLHVHIISYSSRFIFTTCCLNMPAWCINVYNWDACHMIGKYILLTWHMLSLICSSYRCALLYESFCNTCITLHSLCFRMHLCIRCAFTSLLHTNTYIYLCISACYILILVNMCGWLRLCIHNQTYWWQ